MIISEKGLVRAMKSAWKAGGYRVADISGGAVIWTSDWCVRCGWHSLPRKVLGLIVEHAGIIPERDHALALMKNMDPQWILKESVADELAAWWTPQGKPGKAVLVPVNIAGYQLYQTPARECYAVDPAVQVIVDRGTAEDGAFSMDSSGRAVVTEEDRQICLMMKRPSMGWGQRWMGDVWSALESVDLRHHEE